MREQKYRFNPTTLKFEEKDTEAGKHLVKGSRVIILSLLIGVVIATVIIFNYETPAVIILKQQNKQLLAQVKSMDTQFDKVQNVLDEIQKRDDNIYRVIFDSDPIPQTVRKAGFGGTDRYEELESYAESELLINTARKLDVISKQAYIQARSYEEVLSMAINHEKKLTCTPAIMPVSNNDLSMTSSGWGMRIHPVYKIPKFHYGMDFVAPVGTPVYATGDGVIKSVQNLKNGHGRHLVVDHGFGYETLYAHLSKFEVREGQHVRRGEVIGYVGNSGTSTGSHLHYEVWRNGKNVDPKYYFFKDLTPEEFDQLVAISTNVASSLD